MASPAFDSVAIPPVAVESHMPPSLLPTFRSPLAKKLLATPRVTDTGRTILAFATRQPSRHNHYDRDSVASRPPRYVPSQQPIPLSMAFAGGDNTNYNNNEILTPETYANSRMAKRQVNDTILSTASEAFDSTDFAHEPHLSPELEDVETAYEVALLASAAHEMADAAEKENRQSRAAMLEREKELEWIEKHDDENEFQRSLLAARLEIENINSEGTTKQRQEVFQRSLLSARISNDARAKETEKELEWIEKHDDENTFQRSLIAARLSNNNSQGSTAIEQRQEAFQRSLLSARIANDARAKETAFVEDEERQRKEEWLGSEVRAASMGGQECLPFDVASAAASSAAAHAFAEVEAVENNDVAVAVEEEKGGDDETMTVVAASMLAETAERMILGEDIAYFEEQEKEQRPAVPVLDNDGSVQHEQITQLSVQEEVLSEVDQWRNDYFHEIRSHVQQKGIEQTKEKLSLRYSGGGDSEVVDSIDTTGANSTTSSKELDVKDTSSENDNVIKRALQHRFLRRVRQRRKLLLVAAAVVIGRRLALAYFGNALRLI